MVLVFDNNVVISASLSKFSVPYKALEKGLRFHKVIRSTFTFNELAVSLYKKKFNRYFHSKDIREEFLYYYLSRTNDQRISHSVQVCRDRKDDIYLDLALSGKADLIVTGDKDLLVLDPFEGIPIITPASFYEKY